MGKKNRSPRKSKPSFHKKYKKHVATLSKKLDKSKKEVEQMLSSRFDDLVQSLTPRQEMSFVPQIFSRGKLQPRKKTGKKCSAKGTCKKCGKMKFPFHRMKKTCSRGPKGPGGRRGALSRVNRGPATAPRAIGSRARGPRARKRTFQLTPSALKPDNIQTQMSGFSTTRVCESHNGSPLKCRTFQKRY